jgi:hypothetical protein
MLASTEIELSFAAYNERQHHEVSRAGLVERAATLRPGEKFSFQGGLWQPEPYVGHAVVSMVDGVPANAPLRERLRSLQNELCFGLSDPSALYLLPGESFHQTVANTLSDEKHRRLVIERGLAAEYPSLVTGAFGDLPPSRGTESLTMRMIGLSIFSTAIGLLGVFESPEDFNRVLHFRDHFYGHERIGNLGIRRTRPFIGHITLAYIERVLNDEERRRLVDVVSGLNHVITAWAPRFHLPHAELRAYPHLAEFNPFPKLPVYRL